MTEASARGPRRGGRPKQFDQVVSLRLPADLYDALIVAALQSGLDVSVLMRRVLQERMRSGSGSAKHGTDAHLT